MRGGWVCVGVGGKKELPFGLSLSVAVAAAVVAEGVEAGLSSSAPVAAKIR